MKQLKLFYNYLNLSMLLFYYFDRKYGFESEWHKEFNSVCFWTLIINYILIILNHHQLLIDPISKFWFFNISVACTTLMILINGKQLKMF